MPRSITLYMSPTIFFHIATKTDQDYGGRFPPPIQHRLRAVSMLLIEDSRDGKGRVKSVTTKTPSRFLQALEEEKPNLVSWNGYGFGLPVLSYEATRRGLTNGNIFHGKKKYLDRQGTDHTDLADVMSFYGAAPTVSLHDAAQLIGLPGRLFDPKVESVNFMVAALEIDVAIIALLYCKWYRAAGSLLKDDDIRDTAARRCKKRLKGEMTTHIKKYLKEFRRV